MDSDRQLDCVCMPCPVCHPQEIACKCGAKMRDHSVHCETHGARVRAARYGESEDNLDRKE